MSAIDDDIEPLETAPGFVVLKCSPEALPDAENAPRAEGPRTTSRRGRGVGNFPFGAPNGCPAQLF
jgi:hypothetical protein